ncbi:arabinose transporter [Rhizobium ruizarguesonis]|uniref:arabinose transporter n=1 Tax=Rhizobium TaxID=379 RepID=UPI0013C1376B|nr:arabinose transporter [Rhizobium ruizarguesonis]NEI96563.1 MFS transporter [Rhizobium ruizarguesonis]NEJ33814.1 MFS transporter [Rhizobium ruizarguesonis]
MSDPVPFDADGDSSVFKILLPKMVVVFVGFLIAGMAMPVLPLHVHNDLGFGTFVVGLISGSQFAASFVMRLWSGNYADRRGPKRAVSLGLGCAVIAGGLYMVSTFFIQQPGTSATILLMGRAVLGAGEGLILTGSVAWGLATAGPKNAGKVIAWVGTAMFGALAAGAPVGTALYSSMGFGAIATATIVLPLLTALIIAPLPPVAGRPAQPGSLRKVIGTVWLPGLGAAFSSVGYSAILTFSVLLFASRQWPNPWLAVTCFAAALVVARIFLGHLPDKLGGGLTALVFVLVEVAGLLLIWIAPEPIIGMIGAATVGVGYSLVFPGFGVAVVAAAPADNRGMAMGLYSACLDLTIATSGPLLGLLGSASGLSAIFLVSALFVVCAAPIATIVLRRAARS